MDALRVICFTIVAFLVIALIPAVLSLAALYYGMYLVLMIAALHLA